jgi:hypothetical protein
MVPANRTEPSMGVQNTDRSPSMHVARNAGVSPSRIFRSR